MPTEDNTQKAIQSVTDLQREQQDRLNVVREENADVRAAQQAEYRRKGIDHLDIDPDSTGDPLQDKAIAGVASKMAEQDQAHDDAETDRKFAESDADAEDESTTSDTDDKDDRSDFLSRLEIDDPGSF